MWLSFEEDANEVQHNKQYVAHYIHSHESENDVCHWPAYNQLNWIQREKKMLRAKRRKKESWFKSSVSTDTHDYLTLFSRAILIHSFIRAAWSQKYSSQVLRHFNSDKCLTVVPSIRRYISQVSITLQSFRFPRVSDWLFVASHFPFCCYTVMQSSQNRKNND